MVFKASASVGVQNASYDETEDLTKVLLTHTDGTQQNSGRTDTSSSESNGTQTNSGSVNYSKIGGTTSTTSNSGHVDTQQLMLSDEAVTHMANQLLESTNGLASTVKGSNISGVYNDTARTLLASDLIARISGEVEAKRAKLVTTVGGSSSTTVNSGREDINVLGGSTVNTYNKTDTTNLIGSSTNIMSSDSQTDEHTIKQTDGSKDTTEMKAGAEGGWILCTELRLQNRMPKNYYIYGLREFNKYEEQSKKGYYIWAVPALKHLKQYPFSKLSRVMCSLLNARAEYLAAESGCSGARKTFTGLFAKNLYWICWFLSRTVAKNYNVHDLQCIPKGV